LEGLVAKLGEPAAEDPVHALRPDHLVVGPLELARMEDEGEALRAAEAAV